MKITVNVECTPEEARKLMGLPDLTDLNRMYTDAISQTIQRSSSFEQMQDVVKQVAPMGQFGLKLFQQLMDSGAAMAAMGGGAGTKHRDDG